MFLQITKDIRNNKVLGHKMVNREDVVQNHPSNHDLISWSGGARMFTRFFVTGKEHKFIYVRLDEFNEADLGRFSE